MSSDDLNKHLKPFTDDMLRGILRARGVSLPDDCNVKDSSAAWIAEQAQLLADQYREFVDSKKAEGLCAEAVEEGEHSIKYMQEAAVQFKKKRGAIFD